MTYQKILIIIGLAINILASIIMLFPYLDVTKNVNDDFILGMDKEGNYTQIKHMNDRRLGIFGFSLFILGFILQVIGTVK